MESGLPRDLSVSRKAGPFKIAPKAIYTSSFYNKLVFYIFFNFTQLFNLWQFSITKLNNYKLEERIPIRCSVYPTTRQRSCFVAASAQKEEATDSERAQYTLPDGSTVEIGPSRFRAPELLFRPDLIGEEYEGIHEVLMYAIQKADLDLRRTLFANVVLSGGSTLFKGTPTPLGLSYFSALI